jgi:hypothetical protein
MKDTFCNDMQIVVLCGVRVDGRTQRCFLFCIGFFFGKSFVYLRIVPSMSIQLWKSGLLLLSVLVVFQIDKSKNTRGSEKTALARSPCPIVS